MSGITRKLFEVLLLAKAPMTHAELSEYFQGFPPSALGATLSNQLRMGRIVRRPKGSRYAYELSDRMRTQLHAEGVDAVVGEKTARTSRPRRDEVADREADAARQVLQASAISMAAPDAVEIACECDRLSLVRSQSLAPSVGNVLPWLDEEEAPPVIGERWRDALRPRPLDD